MKVKELSQKLNLRTLVEGDSERAVEGCYCGDLLTWVMSRIKENDVLVAVAMTVAENVLTEEVNEENRKTAVNALKMAGVLPKIDKLANKEDSILTKEFDKDGVLLSGGETQKVTISRLFARDFDIAVLDEPSSALDPVAESKTYDALIEGTKGKTVIYISHRLSSATRSDNILVFNNGELVEQGTHEELMANNGEYAEMFTLQASGYTQNEEVSDIEE